jgi:ATP-dependent DNA helicase RecG
MINLTPEQSAKQLATLLAASESAVLEFKRISAKHTRIIETVCAFANTHGGMIALGIGDAKDLPQGAPATDRLYGIEENPEGFDDLQRQLMQRFAPPLGAAVVQFIALPCTLRSGAAGRVVIVKVNKSEQVHSIVGNGTWTRMVASNRELIATEIAELSYQRGVTSIEAQTVPIALHLLDTPIWRIFLEVRRLRAGTMAEQLQRIGLASTDAALPNDIRPTRAAVLLFADEPGSLLAAHDGRADIRLMVYSGKAATPSATPNLRKTPLTIRGPLIEQIDAAVTAVLRELDEGLTLGSSGFKTRHAYPERVVKEAIVNAVIHRDYRLNRDIFIRIFDDRIEVESPGTFPGTITAGNIARTGSKARNPLIAQNLREFPNAPNIDAGEGVRMMFAEMAAAMLYPPQYSQNTDSAVEGVTLTLLNSERPTAWDEVSDWVDREGEITNAKLCDIAKLDTLKASRLLATWCEQGLLIAQPDRSKRKAAYSKPKMLNQTTEPVGDGVPQASLLSDA